MKCVMILGEESSGTTALLQELTKHPEINRIEETRHGHHETLYWNKAAALLDMDQPNVPYSELPMPPRQARQELIKLLNDNVTSFFITPNDKERLVFEGWRALCKHFAPVFCEKTPHHLYYWSVLELIYKASQILDDIDFYFIGIIRNPIDTLYSMWDRWRFFPEVREELWTRSYSNLLKFKKMTSKLKIIKYESLVSKPECMRDICNFIDVNYISHMGSSFHQSSIGRWRSDHLFGFQLSNQTKAIARRFGYDSSSLMVPERRVWLIYRSLTRAKYILSRAARKLVVNFLKSIGVYAGARDFYHKLVR